MIRAATDPMRGYGVNASPNENDEISMSIQLRPPSGGRFSVSGDPEPVFWKKSVDKAYLSANSFYRVMIPHMILLQKQELHRVYLLYRCIPLLTSDRVAMGSILSLWPLSFLTFSIDGSADKADGRHLTASSFHRVGPRNRSNKLENQRPREKHHTDVQEEF
jgi:hypothetical protein